MGLRGADILGNSGGHREVEGRDEGGGFGVPNMGNGGTGGMWGGSGNGGANFGTSGGGMDGGVAREDVKGGSTWSNSTLSWGF